MNATRTLDRILTGRRFDPRMVVAALAVLIAMLIAHSVLLQTSTRQADEVAAPVAELCRSAGPAAAELSATGACEAADSVSGGVGPYKSDADPQVQVARGAQGRPGTPGTPGAPGIGGAPGTPGAPGGEGPGGEPGGAGPSGAPGTPGATGEPGTDGEPGAAPPCLDEPNQCRGAQGAQGVAGSVGPAPPCLSEPDQCRGPEGRGIADTQVSDDCRLIVTYTDGATRDAGPVCATESSPEPDVGPTSPAPEPTG